MSTLEQEESRIAPTVMASFTRQLGLLLDSGVNVLRALPVASQHTHDPEFIELAHDLARRMEDGQEFHAAIAAHPDFFGAFYVELVRQGEKDGMLGKALLTVANYLD